jgi:aminopeptidase
VQVYLERLADLAVGFGANVQADQIVSIGADTGQEELARSTAAAAYRRGARFVEVTYFDPFVKRARIEFAPESTLDFVPSWYGERALELGRQHCARISLAGSTAPGALDGLDPRRAGRDRLPALPETMRVIAERLVNWTIVPCPTVPWAALVHPHLDEAAALERLWHEIAHVCRLDEDDPIAAWEARFDALERTSAQLREGRFDAVHFEGPGTDLTIGLLPSSRWLTARDETAWGLTFVANLPSEELFTSPDPERVDGHVRSTRPLVLADGAIIRGLEVWFEGGKAVAIEAEEGADLMRGRVALDPGASRLGEVALVDRESRIGSLGTIFYDTLLDENAVSHIALGDGVNEAVDEDEIDRVNRSGMHLDFMIGGEDVDVTGVTADGERVPILREGLFVTRGERPAAPEESRA